MAVSNAYGSVTSAPATLTINLAQVAPTIVTQPQAVAVAPGADAIVSVVASGNDPLVYQWFFNGAALAGATGPSYTIANAQLANAGSYTVAISNAAGSITSQAAILKVASAALAATAPSFTTQPVGDTVATGHSVTFSAAASGNPVANYQWQVSTDGGSTWASIADGANYSGTSTGTLTIASVSTAMSGYRYRLAASNAAGATTTASLTLSVAAPPFQAPVGLATDSAGNLFVSDSASNTIQFVAPSGAVSLLAGAAGQQGSTDATSGSAQFRQPQAVALDKSENLFLTSSENPR